MDGAAAGFPSTAPDRTTRPLAALLALLVLGQIVLIWQPRYLPTNDGPAHLYSAWVARQLADDPRGPLAEWFSPNPRSIYPNAGYSEFLQLCARFMPLRTAERIALSLYFATLPLAVGLFTRSLGRDPLLPAYFAAGLSFSWLFFLGFFNFLWGVPVVFAFLALERRVLERPTLAWLLAANALLACIFWLHLVAFAAALVAAGVLAVVRRRIWAGLSSVLPVVLLSPLFWPRTVGVATDWEWKRNLLKRIAGALALNVGSAFGGMERTLAIAVGVAVMGAAIWGLTRARSGRVEVVLLAGTFFLAALLAPEAIGAGSVLPARLALFAWLLLAVALDLGRGSLRVAAAGLLAAGIVAHAAFIAGRFGEFDRTMATYMSGVELLPKGARLCSLTYVPKARPFVVRPMATAHSYYYLELASPNFGHYQSSPEQAPQFPVSYTPEAEQRFLGERPLQRVDLERVREWADYLVLWQPRPQQLNLLKTRDGYRPLAKRGDLTVLVHERAAGKAVD